MSFGLQSFLYFIFGTFVGWKLCELAVTLGLQRLIEDETCDAVTYDKEKDSITLNVGKIKFLDRGIQ